MGRFSFSCVRTVTDDMGVALHHRYKLCYNSSRSPPTNLVSDAILTFPIALLGVLVRTPFLFLTPLPSLTHPHHSHQTFPDTPTKTTAFYLSHTERALAQTRLPPRDRVVWSRAAVLGVFKSWQLYVFTIFFTNFGLMETFNFNSLAPIWFKSYPGSFSLSK